MSDFKYCNVSRRRSFSTQTVGMSSFVGCTARRCCSPKRRARSATTIGRSCTGTFPLIHGSPIIRSLFTRPSLTGEPPQGIGQWQRVHPGVGAGSHALVTLEVTHRWHDRLLNLLRAEPLTQRPPLFADFVLQ